VNLDEELGDIIFLVADKNAAWAIQGLVCRPKSLAIRSVRAVIRPHPENDPGCYLRAHDFLRPFRSLYARAIVMFDREGCGNEALSREALEAEVEDRLQTSGWDDRARAVVVDPELDIWVWSDSPEVESALGWAGRSPTLRSWLTEKGFLQAGVVKPARPKEAMEAALRVVRKPRSSNVYQQLARSVSLRRCSDPAFAKLRAALQMWFPLNETHENRDTR
jgi:hypothetical protein